MPLGTDTLIPEHLLEKIEQKCDILICPTLPSAATEEWGRKMLQATADYIADFIGAFQRAELT